MAVAKGSKLDDEIISKILVETSLSTDPEVAKRWNISERSIRRYRERAETDPQLAALVQLKTQLFCRSWVDDAAEVVKVAADETKRRIRAARTEEDAKVIHAIAGAAKIFGELNITYTALTDPDVDPSNLESTTPQKVKA